MKSIPDSILSGSIWRPLLKLFYPLWLGNFFQQLYNTVDTVVVGRLVGTTALASVGCTGPVVNLLLGTFTGLASGAVVVIAQRYGAGQDERVHRAVHTSMLLALLLGGLLTAVGVLAARPILHRMSVPDDALDGAALYLRVYFAGMIPNVVYNMGTGVLRAIGDSRRPLLFLIAASVCNIVLDLLFVAVLHMGILGVALATVASQALSAVLVVLCLLRAHGKSYQLFLHRLRLYSTDLGPIVRIGIPAAIQAILYSISNIVIQSAINAFGTDSMAAWTAYGKVDVIFWMSLNSMCLALTTFTGQNFGAGQYSRFRKGVRVSMAMTVSFSALLSVLLVLLARPILSIFIIDEAVLEIGVGMVCFLCPTYITYVPVELLSGALRSAGRSLAPTLITLFGVCVLRLGWIALAVPLFRSVYAVIASYPITWVITAASLAVYYKAAHWLPAQDAPVTAEN